MLENKVAIVTGASSGIGLSLARLLIAKGAKVALVARTRAKLEEISTELGPDRAFAFPLDVTDFAALARLPEQVTARLGGIDILVNNAGLNHRGPVLEHTPQELADIITTNLTAPIYLTRAVLPHIRPRGIVVNVASLAGMVPVPDEAAYSASKAGLRAFTRALAFELEDRGIRVSTVCPGPVDTGFLGTDLSRVPDLVFSQPMLSADEVAGAAMRCILTGKPEIAVPAMSGKLATMGYLLPAFARAIRPLLERRGAANKRAFARRKRGI